jgi:hypothetical protein
MTRKTTPASKVQKALKACDTLEHQIRELCDELSKSGYSPKALNDLSEAKGRLITAGCYINNATHSL